MNLQIGPILKTLKHNKVASFLIALQIAITMTVITNGISIISQRYNLVNLDTGYDLDNLIFAQNYIFDENINLKNLLLDDIEEIKAIPSVRNVTVVNLPPFNELGSLFPVQSKPEVGAEGVRISYYKINEQGLDTLGMNLIAGEWFGRDEVVYPGDKFDTNVLDSYIISSQLAQRLFPDTPFTDVIGKQAYYSNGTPFIIRGIVENAHAQFTHWENYKLTMFDHFVDTPNALNFIVAAHPGEIDEAMASIESILSGKTPGRIIERLLPLKSLHDKAYGEDKGLMNTLVITIVILTFITIFGIVGLTNFSVVTRNKQIGTRRALGASKSDILRYFLMENFIVATAGIVLGVALTIGLNVFLVDKFAIEKIDWFYIPASILVMWLVSFVAVYWPAFKASSVSPAVATRSA